MDPKRKIEVVAYDPVWVTQYEKEATRLHEIFKGASPDVHHIGSTAVPGLKAKPTIDILVVVDPATNIPAFDNQMETEGYICRGECLDAIIPGTPGRFYYVRKRGVEHLTHINICARGHFQIAEYLALKDYLRTHPQKAKRYGRKKAALSDQFKFDNTGYMKGKDACVKALI